MQRRTVHVGIDGGIQEGLLGGLPGLIITEGRPLNIGLHAQRLTRKLVSSSVNSMQMQSAECKVGVVQCSRIADQPQFLVCL
jgi:hypothetical protein